MIFMDDFKVRCVYANIAIIDIFPCKMSVEFECIGSVFLSH